MDFGIHGMEELILKHGTLKLLLAICFHYTLWNISVVQTKNNLIYTLAKIFILNFKEAEATCLEIATEMKQCFRLKDMINLNVLWDF